MKHHFFKTVDGPSLDITCEEEQDIEVKIRSDGKVLWINAPTCILRICQIKGTILVVDERAQDERQEDTRNSET